MVWICRATSARTSWTSSSRYTLWPSAHLRRIRRTVPWTYPPFLSSDVVSVAMYQAAVTCSPEPQRSEEHTSELQSLRHLVCRLLLAKKKRSEEHTSELQSLRQLACLLLLENKQIIIRSAHAAPASALLAVRSLSGDRK